MKNKIWTILILTLMLALVCAGAQAAVDMSGFVPAVESVTLQTEDPFNPGRQISVIMTDMNEYSFFKMLMPIDGEPSGDAGWDMYVSEKYPSLVRWQSDAGDVIEIDLSAQQPLHNISYAPAGENFALIYNMNSTDVQYISGMTHKVIPMEETEKWLSCSISDIGNNTGRFCVWMQDTGTLLAQSQAAAQQPADQTPAESETPENSAVSFDPHVVIMENDEVKVELVDFHQEEVNWAQGPATESILSLKFYNMTDHKIIFDLNAYLGMDEAYAIMREGNVIDAGRAAIRSFYIQQYKGSSPTALDSLDQLYQLEGSITFSHSIDNVIRRKDTMNFSFSSLQDAKPSAPSGAAEKTEPAAQAAPAAEAEPAPSMRVRTVQLAQDYPVLKTGSKGEAAKKLQQALIDQGFLNSKADGAYGKVTAAAVAEFQKSVGLEATGVADAATQSALYGEKSEVQLTLTGISETEKIRIEALVANEAYEQEHSGYVQLALCYTLFAPENTFHTNGTKTTISFEQGNSYISEHAPQSCLYMGSYYYGTYSQEVVYGSEFKIVETFAVPRAELKTGRKITITNKLIPETLSLMSDDVLMCRDMEYAARIVDPEGYANQAYRLTEADSATQSKVRKHLNGYYWDFWISNQGSYRIEFASKTYKLRAFGITTDGTYTIANDYIIIKNKYTNALNYIPYEFDNGTLKLDPAAGMNVYEN